MANDNILDVHSVVAIIQVSRAMATVEQNIS